jgi:hypothetical protein
MDYLLAIKFSFQVGLYHLENLEISSNGYDLPNLHIACIIDASIREDGVISVALVVFDLLDWYDFRSSGFVHLLSLLIL